LKNLIFVFICSLFIFSCADDIGQSLDNGSSSAASGSYANMLVVNNHLYAVNDEELISYQISADDELIEIDRKNLGFGIESMFHRAGVLFIGSTERLYIFSITDSGVPEEESRTDYSQFQGDNSSGFSINWDVDFSDPVVVEGDIAYVTLASNNSNGISGPNELRLYNIIDLQNPILINTEQMIEPKGLAIDDGILFLCEANNGLKILNVEDSNEIIELYHFDGFRATDVIVNKGVLLVVGPGQLYEFDYSDIDNVFLTATIDL